MTKQIAKECIVTKRAEYLFAVLGPNPDHGKQGVCYSGEYFTICTTDGPDEAKRIAKALNMLSAVEGLAEPVMRD